MTSYRKTMSEAYNSMYLAEDNVAVLRDIVKRKQMMPIKFADGSMKVDLFTASAVTQALDKVNDANREKITRMINTGKKSAFMGIAKVVMKSENDPEIEEELELDEKMTMARQLVDTNKEVMIVKKNKVIVIDKKDQEKYMKQGWSLAEEVEEDLDEAKKSALQRLKNFDKSRTAAGKKPIFTDKKKEEADIDEAIPASSAYALVIQQKDGSREIVAKGSKEKMKSAAKKYGGLKQGKVFISLTGKKVGDKILGIGEEVELDEAPKMRYALVGKDMKIYSMGSDERDLRLDRRSLEKRFPDAAPLKMARLKTAQAIGDKVDKSQLKEEVELDEAKYDLYHKDFSSAMQHAYAMAKKLHGITISPKEIDDKVATGPAKPKEGKTNSYRLKGDKGAIQVQVYNKGGSKPFELNFYKEEVSLMSAVEEQLAKIKGNTPGDQGRRGAVEDDIERAEKKGDKKLVKKLKEDDLDESPAKVWHLANKKFSLISDKDGYTLVKQGSGEEKKLKAKTPADATAELVKKGYRESVEAEKFRSGQPDLFGEASARADAMKAMRKGKSVDPADVDNIATDDDVKAASKNIMMQLRKAVSLRSYDVEFADGKQKVNQKIAQAVQNKYNSMRRPADKEKYQNFIAKSYKNMLQSLKAGYHEQKESVLDKVGKIIREKNNG